MGGIRIGIKTVSWNNTRLCVVNPRSVAYTADRYYNHAHTI